MTSFLQCSDLDVQSGSLHNYIQPYFFPCGWKSVAWQTQVAAGSNLDEDASQQQLWHHQPRCNGQGQVHTGHGCWDHEAHRSTAIRADGHDGIEPQDPISWFSVQADEWVADGQHQEREKALHQRIDQDFRQVESSWMVELVLRLAQEHCPLCRECIDDPQQGKEELRKYQQETREQARLKAWHVALYLQEDQADQKWGRHCLDSANDCKGLDSFHIHHLPPQKHHKLRAEIGSAVRCFGAINGWLGWTLHRTFCMRELLQLSQSVSVSCSLSRFSRRLQNI